MVLTVTKFTDTKSGTKTWEKNGKTGEYTWYSCGAQFAEHGDKWFNGFVKDFELKNLGVAFPKDLVGKKLEVNLTQEEYNGQMKDKFEIIVPKVQKGGGFTDEDRAKLNAIYAHLLGQTAAKQAAPKVVSTTPEYPADELSPEDIPFSNER